MICHSSKTLIDACDSIQRGVLYMVIKSEGAAIKYVQEPARDRKYVLIAYSKLLAEYANHMPTETFSELVAALIDAASPSHKNSFQIASSVSRGVEEMLMDGAIDQTFAFNRQQFIQLSAAKIEHADKLAQEIPQTEQYMMRMIQQGLRQVQQPISAFMKDQKQLETVLALQQATGVAL